MDAQVDVPLVVGMRADLAFEILRNAGLQPVTSAEYGSSAREDLFDISSRPNRVTYQRPAPPVRVAAGTKVELGFT